MVSAELYFSVAVGAVLVIVFANSSTARTGIKTAFSKEVAA